ncbi:MAG: DNA polymerase [SAR324 cluster bacterium]|jgi:DNA polymerase-1|nr:DNA polymerase [SAR324 cluster bacterium]|tara:strand:+ start:3915 stop:5774 length:1860 start_codon:yes stop_codon:yes gene_type:complete
MSFKKKFDHFYYYYLDGEDNTAYLSKLAELASRVEVVTVDLETTGLNPLKDKIALIGIGVNDKKSGWNCFLFDQLDHDFTKILRPLLESKKTYKLGHNFKFDWSFLWYQTGIDCQPILDTMLAAIVCEYGTMQEKGRWGLAALSLEKLGRQMDKDEELRTSFKGAPYTERQIHYAASDLVQTGELWNSYAPSLSDHFDIVKLECDIIPAVGSIELAGMKVDMKKLKVLVEQANHSKKVLEQSLPIVSLTQGTASQKPNTEEKRLNPNSHKQIKEYFREFFGIELKDTSEKTLKEIESEDARELSDLILQCKANKKLIGTYLKKLDPELLPEDGRIRGRFLSMGARTGRFSAQGILQTVPRQQEIRELFVPEEGNCFVIADYSQIELRVSAELSGEKVMQEAFENDEDLHRLTASKAFGVQLGEVSKAQRRASKAINFGLIYGMSSKGLVAHMKSSGTEISLREAKHFRAAFFKLYRSYQPYHYRLWKRADREFGENGEVLLETRSGRVRRLIEDDMRYKLEQNPSKKWPRKTVVYNTPVQSLASDGLKQALVLLWPHLKTLNARPVNLVHDEIIIECRKDVAEEMSGILEECMVQGMECYLKKVPILVEAKITDSWAGK